MKRLFIIAAIMLLGTLAKAQDGKSIYNKFSDEQGVSAVYISPSMFKLIGKLPEIEIGEYGEKVDITPIVKNLKGFYLIKTSDNRIMDRMNSDVKRLLNSSDYELMMEAKDDGETVRFYTDGDDSIIRSFVMMTLGGTGATFISMDGLINREALEKAIGAAMQ
jgi:hypothetical protein